MDTAESCARISNSYYNLGLERARERDFSGAVPCLKRALEFDKRNMYARNLLGLILYETGEMADALVHWVISMNLQPTGNRADLYLDDVQRKPGRLAAVGQVIERYNQALSYAQNGNKDLAILMLSRAVEENPKYVKANLLLAVLYMDREDYQKAEKAVSRVLSVDRANPKALWYQAEIRKNAGKQPAKKEAAKKTKTELPAAAAAAAGDDVIIPPTYKENTGWQTMLNIGMGLLIGAASILFLYMPTKTAQLSASHNKDLMSVEEQLNQANSQIKTLTDTNSSLTTDKNDLTNQLNTIQEADTYKLSQYQKLVGILDDYRNNDYSHAADLFASIDASQLTDVDDGSGISVSQIYQSITGKMNAEGYVSLAKQGDTAYAAGDYQGAIAYYDKALAIKPDYEEAMFKKAMSYKQMGDIQNANNLFGEILTKFPNTAIAGQAKTERGY